MNCLTWPTDCKTYSGLAKVRGHWQLKALQHWTSRKKYSNRMSTPVLEPVTYCTLWSLVWSLAQWLESLQFSVTGSKTGVDILFIQKSNHFESKWSNHPTRWQLVTDDPHSRKTFSKVFLSFNYYCVWSLLYQSLLQTCSEWIMIGNKWFLAKFFSSWQLHILSPTNPTKLVI